ncbi:integrase catalytic domain-containing protein [Trichonephila clavipes]|nr:integrase catalytic domain-containing protein [Trichonephila clavipes]
MVRDSHEKVFHGGVSETLLEIRELFWLIKGRQTVKNILKKCLICKRFSSTSGVQVTAPLPALRVEQSAPFSVVGIDFALRSFISRRGLCSKILTDNAKTFKKSELELKTLWKIISDPTVKAFYASHKIYWQFIMERAPWWGGFYERLIRTVKLALRKTVGRATLFRDELETLLIEIEGEIKEFKIDDVVLINDEKFPRHFWKLGKVVDVFSGRDGKIRSCKIKTQNSIIKRPVQLLHNLELNE